VLQRDSGDGGTVTLDETGFGPSVNYTVNAADKRSILAALKTVLRICAASGLVFFCFCFCFVF
jgi:hypothetical protein